MFDIAVDNENDTCTVRIKGKATIEHCVAIKERFVDLGNAKSVVLDLSGIKAIDLSFIQLAGALVDKYGEGLSFLDEEQSGEFNKALERYGFDMNSHFSHLLK